MARRLFGGVGAAWGSDIGEAVDQQWLAANACVGGRRFVRKGAGYKRFEGVGEDVLDEFISNHRIFDPGFARPISPLNNQFPKFPPQSVAMALKKFANTEEMKKWLKEKLEYCKISSENMLGYPRNPRMLPIVKEYMQEFAQFGVHNLGDWESGSCFAPTAFDMEEDVIRYSLRLFGGNLITHYGYVEGNGSISNAWAVAVGRNVLQKRFGKDCKPVLIFSEAGHYSFDNAAAFTGLEFEKVPANDDEAISIEGLKGAVAKYVGRPILMCIMAGTTVKGGLDDIEEVIATVLNGRSREEAYFHADAALSGPSLRRRMNIGKESAAVNPGFDLHDIDSACFSTHKDFGTQHAGSVYMARREHADLDPRTSTYTLARVNKVFGGSRDASPIIEFWLILNLLDEEDFLARDEACRLQAQKMAEQMRKAGTKTVKLAGDGRILYFTRPSERLMKKYILAPDGENCHAVILASTLRQFGGSGSADRFMGEYLAEMGAR